MDTSLTPSGNAAPESETTAAVKTQNEHNGENDMATKATKEFRLSDEMDVVTKYLEKSGMTAIELSRELGMSDGYIGNCISKGQTREFVVKYVKMKQQLDKSSSQNQGDIVVMHLPKEHKTTIEALFKSLGISFQKVL